MLLADAALSASVIFALALLSQYKTAPISCQLDKIMGSRGFPSENTNKWKNIGIKQLKYAIAILIDTIRT